MFRRQSTIDGAGFTDAKCARLLEVNKRFKSGVRSNLIAEALGVTRSQVSMDLHEIGKLTGEELRPRAAASAKRKTTLDLIERTREKRGMGKRAASVYGYHSLRATFVVIAAEAGVPLADIARVVGHTTTDMTAQYSNPERKHAAERVRRQLRGSVLDGDAPAAALPQPTNAPALTAEALIVGMSEAERKDLARRLLGL